MAFACACFYDTSSPFIRRQRGSPTLLQGIGEHVPDAPWRVWGE
ncbi:hypothetical protein MC7420_3546 [Coleofasciculus chthonoplastes PCC 7420]|uniref:Uncharacterized protein n=1 Tax=Coleofasciculus chthonoplastes PCC 7420 TaxID=118168 RepID=B4W003_9CYAN|nr:hypothetical protein MC7420_3546 [Coleofasciculus chthonoplastes PCC 7420]